MAISLEVTIFDSLSVYHLQMGLHPLVRPFTGNKDCLLAHQPDQQSGPNLGCLPSFFSVLAVFAALLAVLTLYLL